MIKKIIFFLFLSCLIFSCGKKGDPKFKISKKIELRVLTNIT